VLEDHINIFVLCNSMFNVKNARLQNKWFGFEIEPQKDKRFISN